MDQSIRSWHDACYAAFGALLEISPIEERYAEQLPHSVLVDLLGRFNVWAGNIGAGQEGRASLDYRLREAAYIKEAVVRTLRHLSEAIQQGNRVPYDENPSDSESSASSGADDLNRDGHDEPSVDPKAADERTELEQIQHSMTSFLSNLYQISIIVRKNPANYDRTVRSAKIDTSFYEYYDKRHVQEKFPRASEDLVRRLGTAISKRRKYFKYREQHRQKLSAPQVHSRIQEPLPSAQRLPVIENKSNSPIADFEKAPADEVGTPSLRQTTSVRESTTASTLIPQPSRTPLNLETIDQQSDAATQTTCETTLSSAPDRLRIPEPPKGSYDAHEFECPYCFTIYRHRTREQWKKRRDWKQHVLQDLQPYVCTFDSCPRANTLYERRGDWMRHEVQCHRREWSCNVDGHEIYTTRTEIKAHMKGQHNESFSVEQLDGIIDMLERPANSSLSSFCPLCYDVESQTLDLDRLERHLGHHLQVLATFALPSTGYDINAPNDSIATQNARNHDEEASQGASDYEEDSLMSEKSLRGNSNAQDEDLSGSPSLNQKEAIVQEIATFRMEAGSQQIPRNFGARSVQNWVNGNQSATVHSLRSCLKGVGAPTEITPFRDQFANANSQDMPMTEIFDSLTQYIEGFLEREMALSKASTQYQSLLRTCIRDFAIAMKDTISQDLGKSQHADLLNSLETLETHLSLPLPSEPPAEFTQDWGFLTPQPNNKVSVDAKDQGEVVYVDGFCKWLAPVDQSSFAMATLKWIHPGTCLWLERNDEYRRFVAGDLTVLLVQGLRKRKHM
ncbi:MAG: hypothetical protein Q9216_006048 [Gyalolechia sp. 2 TL-2023]